MQIKSEILNYALSTEGSFYIEDDAENEDGRYYIFFDDKSIDEDNAIVVNEEDDQVTVYTTSKHDFNNNLGFLINICSTTDKECAIMICEALNSLKGLYDKHSDK